MRQLIAVSIDGRSPAVWGRRYAQMVRAIWLLMAQMEDMPQGEITLRWSATGEVSATLGHFFSSHALSAEQSPSELETMRRMAR